MEKLKIGDYVRTDKGTIFKVEHITEIDVDGQWLKSKIKENSVIKDLPRFLYEDNDEYIIKSSDKLIDLIEVGDYVNGEQIIDTRDYDNINNEKLIYYYIPSDYGEDCFRNKDIKSIVTKEQFENIEYRIGE